jgi:hypothetical protein
MLFNIALVEIGLYNFILQSNNKLNIFSSGVMLYLSNNINLLIDELISLFDISYLIKIIIVL